MSGANSFSVPCVQVCLPGSACPNAGNEARCTYSHKRVCSYSTGCNRLDDADHCLKFYHPNANCDKGVNCEHPQSNHWTSYAHPCFIRGCEFPTVPFLNGWLCGYHHRRITTRYQIEAVKRPMGENVKSIKKPNV